MKKLSIIVGLALAMLTAACSKENTTDVTPSLKTVIGVGIESPDSRTYLGEQSAEGTYPVLWSEGDKVGFYYVDTDATGKKKKNSNAAVISGSTATFTADFEKKILLAIATIQLERGVTNESIKGN